MIKFENVVTPSPEQWKAIIMGARNPLNSWNRSDSGYVKDCPTCKYYDEEDGVCRADDWSGQPINTDNCHKFRIGSNDLDLMKRLRSAGTDHRKFMRMIAVYVDITAPLYWWKEFDTYKVGTVANSCSTMHKIAAREFTLEDFSTEHLWDRNIGRIQQIVDDLNDLRDIYLHPEKHDFGRELEKEEIWWQMIQLLPSSYNQKRTVMMNYEVLANIYKSRKNHKLDEWKEHDEQLYITSISDDSKRESIDGYFGFCDWIKTLPYSELITGPDLSDIPISNEIMEEAKRRVFEESKS